MTNNINSKGSCSGNLSQAMISDDCNDMESQWIIQNQLNNYRVTK